MAKIEPAPIVDPTKALTNRIHPTNPIFQISL